MDTANEVVLVHIVGELPPSKVAANRKQPSYGFIYSCIKQIASRKYLGFTLGNLTQIMKVCFRARNWSNPIGFSEVAAATKLSGPKEVRFDEIWTKIDQI